MKFWDSSAIIPLYIEESKSRLVRDIVGKDAAIAAWWGSFVECCSTFARLRRDRVVKPSEEERLRQSVLLLSRRWTEIEPSEEIRSAAARLLLNHPLHAADSMQLAAAWLWAGRNPIGHHFVCLDRDLRTAARREGFQLLPDEL